MPRNGSGTYSPPAGQPVVPGTTISATTFNALVNDLGTEFTRSLATDGQSPMAANLPMGGFKITNMAPGTVATDGVRFDQLTAASASSNIGFIQSGAGAVATNGQTKMRESISVQDFGVVGDGVTDDTAGVIAACAKAYSTNRILKWNNATCKVTANIPSLHLVTHEGPGALTRGGNTFNVAGTGSCKLYVATSGNASNDGMTSDVPMAGLQNAFNAIANYGPVVTQKFYVYVASGTYTAPTPITHYTPSIQQVEVIGADVGGGRNVPSTIIDGAGGAAYSHGIYAQGWGVRLKVQDIKGINFNNGGGSPGDRTRGFVVFDRGVDGWTKNVHVTAASWFGIYGTSAQQCLVESGILDGCRIGVNTDRTRCTVGWNALVAGSARPLIQNSTEQGVSWTNGTQGHVDYTDFLSNAIGLHMEGGSRCDAVQSDFKLNTIGVECFPGGYFGNNPLTPCTFNVGTANANTIDIKSYYGGGDYNVLLSNSTGEAEVDRYRGVMTITGDTADHVIYTSTAIPSGFFKDARQRIRICMYGVVTTAALPATLKTTVCGVSLANMVMPANGIAGQAFKLEIELFSNSTGNHYVHQKLSAGTATTDRFSGGTQTFAFTDSSNSIVISGALQASGDSLVINRIAIFAAG